MNCIKPFGGRKEKDGKATLELEEHGVERDSQ